MLLRRNGANPVPIVPITLPNIFHGVPKILDFIERIECFFVNTVEWNFSVWVNFTHGKFLRISVPVISQKFINRVIFFIKPVNWFRFPFWEPIISLFDFEKIQKFSFRL